MLMKMLRQLRLGRSLFSHEFMLPDERASSLDKETIAEAVLREQSYALASHIARHHKDQIKGSKVPYGSKFELRLMVMSLPEFKDVVEDAIALLPESTILEIKNRKL